jgi:hypothetical protein
VVGSVVGGLLILLCCILLLLAASRRKKREQQQPTDSELSKQKPSDLVPASEISQTSRNLQQPQQVEMITMA